MEFQDRILTCVDCGAEFIWTAGEQQFFADKNFKNEPKRCKACKGKRASRPAGGRHARERVETHDELFGLRQGNDGALQADAGAPGVLQGMLPVPEIRRGRRRLADARRSSFIDHDRTAIALLAVCVGRCTRDAPARACAQACVKLTIAFYLERFHADRGTDRRRRVVLDLKGKITLGEGDELLKDKVNSLVNQGHKKIVLNLADVPYIDSAGLGEVVRTYTTVSRQGGSLKLLNLTKRITDLLSITKLLTVFETFDSENDAVQSFSASAKV